MASALGSYSLLLFSVPVCLFFFGGGDVDTKKKLTLIMMYDFSMQNQYKEMRARFKASSEEQQMDNPCVTGE